MGDFLLNSRLSAPLRAHDWTSFVRGYNGPHYAINRYDVRLNGEFQKYSAGSLPDLNVRAAQVYLDSLGFHPGPIDGIAGVATLSAFAQFQADQGVAETTTIDGAAVPFYNAPKEPEAAISYSLNTLTAG